MNNTAKQLVEQLGDSQEITIMADIVHGLDYEYDQLLEENEKLKYFLNDVCFCEFNDNVEFGLRYLRKIGYVGFDEEQDCYINKHEEEFNTLGKKEKDYYLKEGKK